MNTDIGMRENFDEHNLSSKKANLRSLKTKHHTVSRRKFIFKRPKGARKLKVYKNLLNIIYILKKGPTLGSPKNLKFGGKSCPLPQKKINGVNTSLLFRPTTSTKLLQKKRFAPNFMKSNKQ